jgi:hypothetical protein
MTLRLKLALGLALAAFAVCHVAAAYKIDAGAGRQSSDILALQGD